MKTDISCPVCCGETTGFFGKFTCRDYAKELEFEYHKCFACNHLFLHPLPDDDLIANYYSSKFTNGNYRNYERFDEGKQIGFNAIIEEIASKFDKGGSILEFGCGEGLFLKRLSSHGFRNLWGMDISKVAISDARTRLSTDYEERLFCGTEYDLPDLFQSCSIDAIVGLDVIEHMRSPLSFLKNAFDILTPNGWLILTTPSLDSFASKLLKTHWQYFLPLEHIHLFSSNSMKVAMSKVGFSELVIAKQKRYFDLNYAVSCVESIYGFEGKMWNSFQSLVSVLSKVVPGVRVNVGLMTVLARKKQGVASG